MGKHCSALSIEYFRGICPYVSLRDHIHSKALNTGYNKASNAQDLPNRCRSLKTAERHFLSHILYKGTARSFLNADYITSAMAGWFHWATYQVNCLESEACALRYRLTGRSIRSFLMRQSSFLWHNRCWKRCVYWLGSSTFERYQWKAVSEPEQWWHYMHSQNRSIYENENLVNHC